MASPIPYEVHVTVDGDHASEWYDVCRQLDIKPLHIELASGLHRRQVMCAAVLETNEAGARELACNIESAAWEHRIPVVRTKVECQLDKAQHVMRPAYHEAHMKLMVRPEYGAKIVALCEEEESLHASRNLLARDDDYVKWYVTSRAYGTHWQDAASQFMADCSRVAHHFPAVRVEMECVLYDTNPSLDIGWAG